MKESKHSLSKRKKLTPDQLANIEEQVAILAETIVSANYFVLDVTMEEENSHWYLRIYLDHPNPAIRITLEDCRDISSALEEMIDENVKELHDFLYSLEVSSPGLFRQLAKPREFRFYQGRRIEIAHVKPVKGESFIAYLHGYDDATGEIAYRLSSDEESEVYRIHWDPKKLNISLSPDLTEKVDTKTIPRRITNYD